jgi:hypothetical protein
MLFEKASIPPGEWNFLFVIERCLPQLEERLKAQIDLTEGLGALTISGRIKCYEQLVLRRVIELIKAISVLWANDLEIGALVTARALFETIVSFHDFFDKTKKAEEAKDYAKLSEVVNKFVLSSRNEELRQRLNLHKTNHILEQVRAYGRAVEPQSEKFYDQVSDTCHPNGYAMLSQYGRLTDDLKFKVHPERAKRVNTFRGIYNCVYQICWLYTALFDLDTIVDRIQYLPESPNQL